MSFAIVLVAAGASARMGFDKLWADLSGQPLLAHAIAAARAAHPTQLVVVVAHARVEDACRLAPEAIVVPGGARRRDSVAAGLTACSAAWLAIHDAARALVPPELFARGLAAAQSTGAAIPVLPLTDTIKRLAPDGFVSGTPPRAEHVAVQTPQFFRRDLLDQALALTDEDVTDEATLIERLGIRVATFPGSDRAFKVTTPLDFALARAIVDGGVGPTK